MCKFAIVTLIEWKDFSNVPASEIIISNKLGLHARAAAKLVNLASRFPCQIRLGRSEEPQNCIDAKSIMSVMLLAAGKGSKLWLHCNGQDEKKAMQAITSLVNNLFEEGE